MSYVFTVKVLDGMDAKIAKKITTARIEDGSLHLSGAFDIPIAKMKTSSITKVDFYDREVSAGFLKGTKTTTVARVFYTTKSGEDRQIVMECPNKSDTIYLYATLLNATKKTGESSEIPAQVNPSASSKPSQNSSDLVTEHIHVRGESFYEESFNELRYKNYEYDYSKKEIIEEGLDGHRIYQYDFDPVNVELIDEPDNPKDPNAIAVYVCGHQIGYVPHGSTAHIRNVREKYGIQRITAEMGGGKYKIVFEDYDNEGSYSMDHGEVPNWAIVSISYRKTEKSEES